MFANMVLKKMALPVTVADAVHLFTTGSDQLWQSMLGQSSTFWVTLSQGTTVTDKKNFKKIFEVIKSYKGPHRLVVWINGKDAVDIKVDAHIAQVTLEDIATVAHFGFLAEFINGSKMTSGQLSCVESIVRTMRQLSIDQAVILAQTLGVVSAAQLANFQAQFIADHAQEGNLFELGDHFFLKDEKKFFVLWDKVCDNYSEHYWIAFWSSKLWRAYCLILAMQNNASAEKLKKLSFGLPYKFVWKKGWQVYSCDQLVQLYSLLYQADCRLKLGGSDAHILDWLFFKNFS